jgi:TonB family protein
LAIHLFIFFLLFVELPKIKKPPPSGKEQKISLNLTQFKTPPPAPKPVVVPPQPKPVPPTPPVVQPPVPKPVVKPIVKPVEKVVEPTPVIKKKLVEDDTRTFVEHVEKEDNNVTKPKKEELAKKETKKEKTPKKEKVAKKEKIVKKVQKKKTPKKRVVKRKPRRKKSRNPLANALMGSGTSMFPTQSAPASSGSYSAQMINQLYGKEFNSFSPTQKKFIKQNLGLIHKITQLTLVRNGYPEIAIRTRQQGTNVVSFYLHPNGDISGLRLKRKIGYASLDKNTLEVIRIAYKDYPLPNKKTKIVFYVQYSIY